LIVAVAIGDGREGELQRLGRLDRGDRSGIAAPRENVEDDVGGMDALGERLGAGGFDRRQPIGKHGGENLDHLPIAVVGAGAMGRWAVKELGLTHEVDEIVVGDVDVAHATRVATEMGEGKPRGVAVDASDESQRSLLAALFVILIAQAFPGQFSPEAVERMSGIPAAVTFTNTFVALDDLDYQVGRASERLGLIEQTSPSAAVRDAARVLGHDYGTGDRLSKMIPDPEQGRSPSESFLARDPRVPTFMTIL